MDPHIRNVIDRLMGPVPAVILIQEYGYRGEYSTQVTYTQRSVGSPFVIPDYGPYHWDGQEVDQYGRRVFR